ncbi:MAG TPA: ABC transporter permease [Acidobacteriota bacterium]
MDHLWRDIKVSFRNFAKHPGFTSVAVISLALGIGANTTIFTLINAVFLNPIPVEQPSELVAVYTVDSNNPGQFGNLVGVSFPNYKDYRDQNEVLSGLTGYTFPFPISMSTGKAPEQIFTEMVTANYFDVLGVRPVQGRFFLPDESETPGAHPLVVMSHGLWKRMFGSDPGMVGRTIKLNGHAFTVIGVAPEGFKGVNAIGGPELWVPLMMYPQLMPAQFRDWVEERRALLLNVAGRLKPGASIEQAEANLKAIAGRLEKEYPEPNTGRTASLLPLTQATIFPGLRDILVLGGIVLLVVVGLVLLIACSNVANLLLAKAAARRKEIAIRLSLGAGRGRLVRQLLTESTLLALLGGAAGLLVAYWGRDFIWSFRPPFLQQNILDLTLDARVMGFTLLVSLVTGVLFGLVPALQSSRPDLVSDLKEETVTTGRARRGPSLRNSLVVAQVALSIVALVTAGLFLRSLGSAHNIDPGFNTTNLAVITLNPGQLGYDQPRSEQFFRSTLERAHGIPGVRSASLASNLPLFGGFQRSVFLEGQTEEKGKGILTNTNSVDLDYFEAMGIGFLRGRDFTELDRTESVPVAIINQAMVQRFWPDSDPLGKRFKFYGDTDYREVVGVVRTSNYTVLGEKPQPCAFIPARQNFSDFMTLYLRAEGDPAGVLATAQKEIHQLDPEMPLTNVWTIGQVIDQSLWPSKLGAALLTALGLIALLLASIGLYGVMGYWVAQNNREIGIRMAIGARQPDVLKLVLLRGMLLVGIGLGIGLVVSLAVSRLLASLLYGSATDPLAFLGTSLVLVLVALVASYVPAYRASRVDPLIALRT